jgi:hypothetical protein
VHGVYLLHRNEKRWLVFKAYRWLYHSSLGSSVIQKKKEVYVGSEMRTLETRDAAFEASATDETFVFDGFVKHASEFV